MPGLEYPRDIAISKAPTEGDVVVDCRRWANAAGRRSEPVARALAAQVSPDGLIARVQANAGIVHLWTDQTEAVRRLFQAHEAGRYWPRAERPESIVVDVDRVEAPGPLRRAPELRRVFVAHAIANTLTALGHDVRTFVLIDDSGPREHRWDPRESPPEPHPTVGWRLDPEAVTAHEARVEEAVVTLDAFYEGIGLDVSERMRRSELEDGVHVVVDEGLSRDDVVIDDGLVLARDAGRTPALLRRSDGSSLYLGRELALTRHKLVRLGAKCSICVRTLKERDHFANHDAIAQRWRWMERGQLLQSVPVAPLITPRRMSMVVSREWPTANVLFSRIAAALNVDPHPPWSLDWIWAVPRLGLLEGQPGQMRQFPTTHLDLESFGSSHAVLRTVRHLQEATMPGWTGQEDGHTRLLLRSLFEAPSVVRRAAETLDPSKQVDLLERLARRVRQLQAHQGVPEALASLALAIMTDLLRMLGVRT